MQGPSCGPPREEVGRLRKLKNQSEFRGSALCNVAALEKRIRGVCALYVVLKNDTLQHAGSGFLVARYKDSDLSPVVLTNRHVWIDICNTEFHVVWASFSNDGHDQPTRTTNATSVRRRVAGPLPDSAFANDLLDFIFLQLDHKDDDDPLPGYLRRSALDLAEIAATRSALEIPADAQLMVVQFPRREDGGIPDRQFSVSESPTSGELSVPRSVVCKTDHLALTGYKLIKPPTLLHYKASTNYGSSGSPVILLSKSHLPVVAIHRAGVDDQTHGYNLATCMSDILNLMLQNGVCLRHLVVNCTCERSGSGGGLDNQSALRITNEASLQSEINSKNWEAENQELSVTKAKLRDEISARKKRLKEEKKKARKRKKEAESKNCKKNFAIAVLAGTSVVLATVSVILLGFFVREHFYFRKKRR